MPVLDGFRVIDVSTGLAGPYAGQLLRAYGADVIKVELPGSGDFVRTWGPVVEGSSLYFAAVNRGKRSIALNLKEAEGRDILLRLIAEADVLVENFRPGTLESWGLGPDETLARTPGLVFCRISGFGQSGPYSEQPAFDPIIQAISGYMSVNGEPDGQPVRAPLPLSDLFTGIHAALAVVAALHEPEPRANNVIDLSLLDVMMSTLYPQNLIHLGTTSPIERLGNRHPSLAPYEVFETSDRSICVAVANEGQWRRFCAAVGVEHLADDQRFRSNPDRLANRHELRGILEDRLRSRSADDVLSALQASAVPCAPINTVAEAFADPQVIARDLVAEVSIDGRATPLPKIPPQNWDFGANSAPPPRLGEHTDEILAQIDVPAPEIDRLREAGVIG